MDGAGRRGRLKWVSPWVSRGPHIRDLTTIAIDPPPLVSPMRVAGVAAIGLLLSLSLIVNAIGPGPAEPVGVDVSTSPSGDDGTEQASALYTDLQHVVRRNQGDTRDITLRGDYAYTAGHVGIRIYDISDPTNPTLVGSDYCPSRDLAVQGDTLAVVREGWGEWNCGDSDRGVAIYDVSDPTDPTFVRDFDVPAHTITAQPGTDRIHIASSDLVRDVSLRSGFQEIIRAPSPASATMAPRFYFPTLAENGAPVNAPSCHEITFNAAGTRAFCAGVVETHIWDTSDPADIRVLSVIHNPSISIHHGAFVDATGDLLVLNDEFAGVLTAQADACLPLTQKSPYGALWFYDISDETTPVPLSWIEVPSNSAFPYYCTSHFGNILPNNQQLVWGWYSAGPVLVDFSDMLQPRVEDHSVVPDALTWGAYYHDGYVYTGDMNRGFEVFALN